ncbi:MAG: glycosyltransferase family 4 protein [Actinomycetales bacterium]
MLSAAIREQLAHPRELPGKVFQLSKEMTGVGMPHEPGRPGALTVGIDATPLVGSRTGVGRYVERVSAAVAELDDAPDQVWTLFSRRLPLSAPPPRYTRLARRNVPSAFLQPLWRRMDRPAVEYLTGPIDVFHGGNFVMPPTRRAATVVTIHDLTFRFFPEAVQPATMAVLQRLPEAVHGYDAILTVSEAVAEEIVAELAVPRERIVVAPNGVDSSWIEPPIGADAELRRIGVPDRYFCFLGTMEPRKNLPTLLDAYAAARAERPDLADLVIVGGAGWGERVQPPAGVRTLGYLPDADVHALMSRAVAVCSPSVYEGFGLPVLEGMATGRPVLASDIAAHREVAQGQATLIPVHDRDAWTQALLRADHGEIAVSEARRDEVVAQYTWERSARIHLDTYAQVGGRSATSSPNSPA